MNIFSKYFFEGGFGLERETLRIDENSRVLHNRNSTAVFLVYIELKSNNTLNNCSSVQFDCMHTALFIFVEIKTE